MDQKGKVKTFITLSLLGLLLINITLISGYLLILKYGSMTLNPGEEYIVNIPFSTSLRSPVVEGRAEQSDGTPLKDVTVKISYSSDNNTILGQAVTDSNGDYRIILPEITSKRTYAVHIEYNNGTLSNYLALASNDYELDFDDDMNYNRSKGSYVFLTGKIRNEDARIENGRFEINLKYYNDTRKEWIEILDYKEYSLDIESNEIYEVPNKELNFSWKIPSNVDIGKYKFYIKTSFNARDRSKDVYFNITS